ncbi:hypothetical protein ACFC26_17435 [Kitasatospora purpeofusca]|uniref:hypothetical protein n=1 Tax=Kitasatospora purpeofusca TaxID=67352 RepID=UPI0035E1B9A7
MLFRPKHRGTTVLVDPSLPKTVIKTVHMLARQHPRVLRDPAAPLPRTAGFDHADAALGARAVLFSTLLVGALGPTLYWLMTQMQEKTADVGTNWASSPTTIKIIIVVILSLGVVANIIRMLLAARAPGGRKAVARDLAEARGRYLLRGEQLDSTAWTAAARAQRALLNVAASTWLVSAVDEPDHQALSAGFWTLAQGMTGGNTAGMDSFAAAVEVYAQDIEAANALGVIRREAGEGREEHDRAIERANRSGRHALAMTTAV